MKQHDSETSGALVIDRDALRAMRPASAFEHVRKLRDRSFEKRDAEGVRHSISLCQHMFNTRLGPRDEARLHYFLSNAWEKLRILRHGSGETVWAWEQEEIEKELIHLRRALQRDALKDMSTGHICQVLTNMATLMNHVGRAGEAQEIWDRAVGLMPSFAMARGKRGYSLTHYATVLYDNGHIEKFLKKARGDLKAAVGSELYDSAKHYFGKRLRWVESTYPNIRKGRGLALFDYNQPSSPAEVTYRKWCLENRLFLNPLNDLGPYPAAMRDVLHVPPMVRDRATRAHCQGLFNQMKQAFVSARYLYYEGVSAESPHFSDRDVILFDTMDYPSYSLAVEKVKAAYGMLYGIFDKAAYFINHYMGLGIADSALTFRSLWYNDGARASGVREEFAERRNWPMRGLFWLSKDLYEDAPGFDESLEPDAREAAEMRYHLGSRYLKLHEDLYQGAGAAPGGGMLVDSLALSVHRGEFEARAVRLMKRVRAAMMYLCYAVHYEEKLRRREAPAGLPAISLSVLDDSWKV